MEEITQLTNIRQWLTSIVDRVSASESRMVYDKINEVDTAIWKLVFNTENSPWDNKKKYVGK